MFFCNKHLFFIAASLCHSLQQLVHCAATRCMLSAALFFSLNTFAQADTIPVFKGAVKANRDKIYNRTIQNTITNNLSLPLTDSTEENWEDAFYAMELTGYRTSEIDAIIKAKAFDSIEKRSSSYQRQLMEMAYALYPTTFREEAFELCGKTISAKVFCMAAEYLLQQDKTNAFVIAGIGITRFEILKFTDSANKERIETYKDILLRRMEKETPVKINKLLKNITAASYLPGNTIVYSLQRKNRNYPGIVIVRDSAGNFVKDESSQVFSVPQLARSMSGLPFYLTNGNTPQGIFRMNGFDVSKLAAIGPTSNIQLMMPFETSPQFFLKDSSIADTSWNEALYEKLLPQGWKKYKGLWEGFYASKVGRTEIIAHGTTVNPDYYKGQPWYPHTPTEGCLCTKEIWSEADGRRTESNQQKLVDVVKKSGKSDGYLIVIELDDQQLPVTIYEVLKYFK